MSFTELFKFKHFSIYQDNCAMKIGTDAFVLGSLTDGADVKTILDIGSGTGVLACMLHQYFNNTSIDVVEIDSAAFQTLQHNLKINNIIGDCVLGDFLQTEFDKSYDLIISNPPYFSNSSKAGTIERALARDNASLPPEEFLVKVSSLLSTNGLFWIILPEDNCTAYLKAAETAGLFLSEEIFIYGKPNALKRKVYAFAKSQQENVKSSELTIRDGSGKYTQEYKKLTKDYHGVELK